MSFDNHFVDLPTPNNFAFPYTPYPAQTEFMVKLYEVVESKKQAIFESPTGTGKTMSILCGILRWLRDHEDRNHKSYTRTISQLENDLRNISDSPSTWFKEQCEEIRLKRDIDKVTKDYNKLQLYNRKLHDILNNKEQRKQKFGNISRKHAPVENEDTNEFDDEFLLAEEDTDVSETICEEENVDDFKPTQIFICSRTHSQLTQFVEELRKSPFSNNTRIVTLASRQNTCICPSVKSLTSSAFMNERCLEMQKTSKKASNSGNIKSTKRKRGENVGKCVFYNEELVETLSEVALCEPQDIEDLVRRGTKMRACPYYASRKASKFAEIILAPYNTVLHKETREANGIDLTDSVLIVDEAHNLLDALRAMNSVILTEDHVKSSIYQLTAYKQQYNNKLGVKNMLLINQLMKILTGMSDFLVTVNESAVFKTGHFLELADIGYLNIFSIAAQIKRTFLLRKIQGFAKSKPYLIEEIARSLNTNKLKKNSVGSDIPGVSAFIRSVTSINKTEDQSKTIQLEINPARIAAAPLHTILAFLDGLTKAENSARILVHSGRGTEDDLYSKRALEYLVLDPSQQFTDIIKDCRSVVVAGGTMKPIDEIKQRLFIKAGAKYDNIADFSWGHIIPPDNILPIILDNAGKAIRFDFQHRNSMTEIVVKVLMHCAHKVRGGIVAFFTSYKYMNWVVRQTETAKYNRPLFIESQEAGSVQSTLDEYVAAVKRDPQRGAIIFSVMGGKLSEGINFKDDLGRCIILFGLPYPYQDAIEYKERLSFLQQTEGIKAGKDMGLIMCMKTVNQCIGRAIRHKDDFATVLLTDERYKQPEVLALLPDWIRSQLKQSNLTHSSELIDNSSNEYLKTDLQTQNLYCKKYGSEQL